MSGKGGGLFYFELSAEIFHWSMLFRCVVAIKAGCFSVVICI